MKEEQELDFRPHEQKKFRERNSINQTNEERNKTIKWSKR